MREVRMVRRVDTNEYRRASVSEVKRRMASRALIFEGVDGDEETNTVTYYYRPPIAGVEE